jgi:hypothetical protein
MCLYVKRKRLYYIPSLYLIFILNVLVRYSSISVHPSDEPCIRFLTFVSVTAVVEEFVCKSIHVRAESKIKKI